MLDASENLQVIEIGVPAEHLTTIDHEMALPTPLLNPDRDFDGQRFCRSEAERAVWIPWRLLEVSLPARFDTRTWPDARLP